MLDTQKKPHFHTQKKMKLTTTQSNIREMTHDTNTKNLTTQQLKYIKQLNIPNA